MKKIPFELFGTGQAMFMDIGRFIALESMTGKPIGEIVKSSELDLGFIVKFLTIALRQHGNRQPQFYIDKIQTLCDEMDFNIETDIQLPIVKCIAGSGILGKAYYYAIFPEEVTEAVKQDIDAEKN